MRHRGIEIYQPVSDNQCRIWPEFAAKKVSDLPCEMGSLAVLDSPRAGGSYKIGYEADDWCKHNDDEASLRVKARLTTWLIDQRLETDAPPSVTHERITQMNARPPLSTQHRADRLLRKLASYPRQIIDTTQSPNIEPELLAWSESVDSGELRHLISVLQRNGYVHFDGRSISVTEAGTLHIQDLDDGPRPKIGF